MTFKASSGMPIAVVLSRRQPGSAPLCVGSSRAVAIPVFTRLSALAVRVMGARCGRVPRGDLHLGSKRSNSRLAICGGSDRGAGAPDFAERSGPAAGAPPPSRSGDAGAGDGLPAPGWYTSFSVCPSSCPGRSRRRGDPRASRSPGPRSASFRIPALAALGHACRTHAVLPKHTHRNEALPERAFIRFVPGSSVPRTDASYPPRAG